MSLEKNKKGLYHLDELVRNASEEYLHDLLDSHIVVTEKLDAARILFEFTDDGVHIWRKDDRTPMSIIDRTLMRYYEKAIDHITRISDSVNVPKGTKFGCYYFTDSALKLGWYSRAPKNNIVLTDVRMILDGVEQIFDDPQTLKKWAGELAIEPMPHIFIGRLNDSQKKRIIELAKMTPHDLENALDGKTFSEKLINILNPDAGSSFLRKHGVYNVDALIFRFKTDKGKTVTAKSIDDAFQRLSFYNQPKEDRIPSDLYSIALMEICAFVTEKGLEDYTLKERTTDFRYLELVCMMFNDFIEANMERYDGVDFSEPEFMKSNDFEMNSRFIENEKTLKFIKSSRTFEQLFKIMLAGMRKKRRRPYGLMTQRMVSEINLLIDAIQEKVQPPVVEGFMDFATFRVFRDDNMQPVVFEPDTVYADMPEVKNILFARRQFFTSEMDAIAKNECGKNRLMCVMFPDNESLVFPFECVEDQVSSASESLPKEVSIACVRTEEELLETIEDQKKDCEVGTIMCETDDMEYLQNLFPWAEIIDIGRLTSEDNIVSCIERDDFSRFKTLCPSFICKLFIRMQGKYTGNIQYNI